jgi:2-aminoadipate transaminase
MTYGSASDERYSLLGQRLTPPEITRLMRTALENPDLLSLAAGFTDTWTLPREEVRHAVDTLLAEPAGAEVLQYGTNQGRPRLRELLAARLAQQDAAPGAGDGEEIFVTNGSQQALALALQTLCDPGDIVLVERPTYFVFLELARGLGIELRSLPTADEGGLDPAGLEQLLANLAKNGCLNRLKAIYLVSYYSNPSSRSLSEGEKDAIGTALARHGTYPALIEDAAYRDLYFDAPHPSRSILRLDSLAAFPRLYAGTCTKAFATGLKVGYAVCPDEAWRERMLYLKGQHDFGTANFNQAIVERVLETGDYDRCLEGLRQHYRRKRDALSAVFAREDLAAMGWHWEMPQGGLYFWLRGPVDLDTGTESAFCRQALENGVLYVPGGLCYGDDPPPNYVRISFGVLQEAELAEAGRRFAATARAAAVRQEKLT